MMNENEFASWAKTRAVGPVILLTAALASLEVDFARAMAAIVIYALVHGVFMVFVLQDSVRSFSPLELKRRSPLVTAGLLVVAAAALLLVV